MIRRVLKAIRDVYVLSWLFLLWSAFCASVGAAAFYAALVAALRLQGLPL